MAEDKAIYTIELNDKLSPAIKSAIASALGLDNALGGVNGTSKKTSMGLGALGGSLTKLLGPMALVAGAMKALSFANETMSLARDFETLQNSIVFASGSAEEGAKTMDFLRKTSNDLGTPLLAGAEGFKTLSGAMMGSKLQGEATRDIYRQVSVASTAMGLDAENSKGVFLALGQIMGKGKVQAEELRGQIGERIPGAFAIASRAMGVTQAELNKLMEGGMLTAEEFLPRFGAELEKTFSGALPKAVESSQAKLNRFNNMWDEMKIKLGTVLLPILNKVMGWFTDFVNFLIAHKSMIMDNVITPLKDLFVGVFNAFGEGFSAVSDGFQSSLTWGEKFRASIVIIGKYIKVFTTVMVTTAKVLGGVFGALFEGFVLIIDGIISLFQGLWATVKMIVVFLKDLFMGLGDIIAGAFTLDSSQISAGASKIANAGIEAGKAFSEVADQDLSVRTLLKGNDKAMKALAGPDPMAGAKTASALGVPGPSKLGAFTPGGGTAGGTTKASTSVDEIKSGRPTNINIDIGKLIENMNITANNIDDLTGQVKDAVAKALMSAVNNVNQIAGA